MSDPVLTANAASLEFTFDYRPREQFRASRAIAARGGYQGMAQFLAAALFLLAVGIVLLGRLEGRPEMSIAKIWVVFLPAIVVFVVIPMSQLYAAHTHRHHVPHTEHTIRLTPEGVELRCVAMQFVTPWHALYRIQETPEAFLFYTQRRAAVYMPKRVVAGTGELSSLRESLRSWAPEQVEF